MVKATTMTHEEAEYYWGQRMPLPRPYHYKRNYEGDWYITKNNDVLPCKLCETERYSTKREAEARVEHLNYQNLHLVNVSI